MRANRTGYTHQWKRAAAYLARFCMASTHTKEEVNEANNKGFRSFRTAKSIDDMLPNEILCPASKEAGHKTTCDRCQLCDGSRGEDDKRKNIFIVMH